MHATRIQEKCSLPKNNRHISYFTTTYTVRPLISAITSPGVSVEKKYGKRKHGTKTKGHPESEARQHYSKYSMLGPRWYRFDEETVFRVDNSNGLLRGAVARQRHVTSC